MTKIYQGNSQGIVPFIDTLQKIEAHFAALSRNDLTSAEVLLLLTEGWDMTRDRRKVGNYALDYAN